ncbi:MAG: hypothetical protein ACTSRU_17855 [Candidatus Hodarchaeales archaeon]
MLKVYKLAISMRLDHELLQKLMLLDRLVRFYAKFLSTWKTAGVFSDGQTIRVRFMTVNKYGYESFTEREFKVANLDERIASYKRKITKEFDARHENTRIQRAKEVHKWKKYIDDAKIQM